MPSQIGPRKLRGRRKLVVLLVAVTFVAVVAVVLAVLAVLVEVMEAEVPEALSEALFVLDVRNMESEGRASWRERRVPSWYSRCV